MATTRNAQQAYEFLEHRDERARVAGFRTLATNGIDKAVLNVFRMAGMMRGDQVKVSSSGAAGLDSIL